MEPDTSNGQLAGNIFLLTDTNASFASHQVELLKAIKHCGSISKAAKEVGISYKTAWDRIDAMNNMSPQPLVLRASGGAKGGGTQLTELGESIISGFESLLAEHHAFIEHLGSKLHSLQDIAKFVRNDHLISSARNQFHGTVSRITLGAVNCEVELDIGAQQPLTAILAKESLTQLALQEGQNCNAIVSDSVIVLSKDTQIATSARNRLMGQVERLVTGAVNSDVTIALGNNKTLNAVITNTSAEEMQLAQGDHICALFKAPSVILMRGA